MNKNKAIPTILFLSSIFILPGCGGTRLSKLSYDESYQLNQINKAEDCYDASIFLDADIQIANDITRKVLVAIDATIQEDSLSFIRAQRNRHIGVFVGSGGEQLFITLQEINDNSTFITVATKTGFVGGAGQTSWSCKVVEELAKMTSK